MAGGVRLSQLRKQRKADTAEIVIDFGSEGSLTLEFDPEELTVGRLKALSRAGRENDFGAIAEHFFSIITDWDLLDDDDEKMPFTEETVDALGVDVFVTMVSELGKQQGLIPATSS